MFAATYVLLADTIFGQVSPPPGVETFNKLADPAAAARGGGLIIFASNLIKVVSIVAGLFGLFNVISAGYQFISSNGNPKATEQASQQLFFSLIGLAVIVGSFTIAAVVSLLLFGRPDYILNPQLPTVQ